MARPWTYDGPDEPYLYDEEVTGADAGNDQERSVYRIYRRPNPNFGSSPTIDQGPLRLDSVASDLANNATTNQSVELAVKVRGFPDWDIPPRIPMELFSPTQVSEVQASRTEAIAARRDAFETHSSVLRNAIEGLGGHIVSRSWETGWLYLELPANQVAELSQRTDLVRIQADLHSGGPDCDTSCSFQEEDQWKLDSGTSSSNRGGRDEDKIDAWSFIDANYDGYNGAENGRFLAAVVEENGFEDEALSFNTVSSGTSRIQGRYKCDTSSCTSLFDFGDETNEEQYNHGTMVANIVLGDFEDNQADGETYGDDCYDGTHCSDWEKAASGMAPEAELIYYSAEGGGIQRYAEAYLHAANTADNVDVVNASVSTDSVDCDITSGEPDEDALEVVFDEGILFVTSAGNNDDGGSTSCDLSGPGDTPKAFTVNAYRVTDADCVADFHDCDLATNKHRMGGMTAPLPSQNAGIRDVLAQRNRDHFTVG